MIWADQIGDWLSANTPSPSIDPTQYGIAGILFAVFGGIILRLFFQMRGDLLARVQRAEDQCAAGVAGAQREKEEAIARERESTAHERDRADRLEAALARLNAEVGPRQAQVTNDAMKAVMDAIRELRK